MVIRKGDIKISRKVKARKTSRHFPFINDLNFRNFAVMLTVKVAVICLLSSIPLIGTVFAPFGLKKYFPGETYDKGVYSRFRISSFGMSCSSIIEAMCLWNVSFSSSKNCLLGSILPVVPILLDHSIDFNTPLAQS